MKFEHYLPSNSNRYNYSAAHLTKIGGLSFLTDKRIYTDYAGLRPTPDSDSAQARSLFLTRAFRLPATAIRARLVHLPDGDNRSELMIIYLEALAPDQVPADAKNEMTADDRFPDLSAQVVRHDVEGLKITGR